MCVSVSVYAVDREKHTDQTRAKTQKILIDSRSTVTNQHQTKGEIRTQSVCCDHECGWKIHSHSLATAQ